jgi:hypothetical protein
MRIVLVPFICVSVFARPNPTPCSLIRDCVSDSHRVFNPAPPEADALA